MKRLLAKKNIALPSLVAAVYLFLYIPIFVVVMFSCNDAYYPYEWHGFTLRWYQELWYSVEIWDALINSLIVACSAVTLSLTMGVLVVWYGSQTILARCLGMFYATLAAPEIVLAVGLLLLFSVLQVDLGFVSLIAAHTLLGLGYVVPMMYVFYQGFNKSLIEASLDLGATRHQTLCKIFIPMVLPTLLGSGLLVFIVSLDDFLISFFCSGATSQTLPMYIFSLIRSGATPVVNALSTVMLLLSSVFVVGFSLLHVRSLKGPL